MNAKLKTAACSVCYLLLGMACQQKPTGKFPEVNAIPTIKPDYTEIIIPPNIAPLNFQIEEKGKAFAVDVAAGDDHFSILSSSGSFGLTGENGPNFYKTIKEKHYVSL